jgi:hypothetical protein
MKFSLPLKEMSTSEKIAAMEMIWDDLIKDPESIPSPEWHTDVLKERELRVSEGKSTFIDFTEVKERIRKRVK